MAYKSSTPLLGANFDVEATLHLLKHYLPTQAPLKDFIHHNTLHAFQNQNFHQGVFEASRLFGYQVYLSLEEYRLLYKNQKINPQVFQTKLKDHKGVSAATLLDWTNKMLSKSYDETLTQKMGKWRQKTKEQWRINLDKEIHPLLFRLLGSYLDQGVAIHAHLNTRGGFLNAIRDLEKSSFKKIFKSPRVRSLLFDSTTSITSLLWLLLEDTSLFERYLFEQQFAHPGWSGMVAVLEHKPENLLDHRSTSLQEVIVFELLLEIDALDTKWGNKWLPLSNDNGVNVATHLFEQIPYEEYFEVCALWQEIYEWSFYEQVLVGLQETKTRQHKEAKSFQAIFCIDDRECSLRRHIEHEDPFATTFSTAGFFNVAFYFQPEHDDNKTILNRMGILGVGGKTIKALKIKGLGGFDKKPLKKQNKATG